MASQSSSTITAQTQSTSHYDSKDYGDIVNTAISNLSLHGYDTRYISPKKLVYTIQNIYHDIPDDVILNAVTKFMDEKMEEMKKIQEQLQKFEHFMTYTKERGSIVLCDGCIDEQPNQLAHMDMYGCLYESDSETTYYSEPDSIS